MIHQGERIVPSDQNERITRAVENGADSTRMATAGSWGGDVHFHVHALDTKNARQAFMDHKHLLRAAVNESYAENSGGADADIRSRQFWRGGRNPMRLSNSRTIYVENPDSIEGKWLTLATPEASDREGLTSTDLDQIVREYGGREESGKAPVVLGALSQGRQEPIARIDEVRRKGGSLKGKFGAVDPRVDYLYGRGAFPKNPCA